jgi:hypothetical protein
MLLETNQRWLNSCSVAMIIPHKHLEFPSTVAEAKKQHMTEERSITKPYTMCREPHMGFITLN